MGKGEEDGEAGKGHLGQAKLRHCLEMPDKLRSSMDVTSQLAYLPKPRNIQWLNGHDHSL